MKLRYKRTTLLIIGLLSFLIGLGLARVISGFSIVWLLLATTLVLISARKRNIIMAVSIIVLGLSVGLWRGTKFINRLEPYRKLSGKNVVFTAKVQSDATYSYQGQLSFDVNQIEFISPYRVAVPGRITVQGFGERAVFRGDLLKITGKLSDTKGSRQARVSFSSFTAVERNQAVIEKTRRSFVAGIATALPEPASSFGLGLLIGYRTTLPEITKEQLAITGLTHIIAVSGYNLTIIIRGTRRLLGKRSKYQQTAVCVMLILLFLLFTDFSASIVRASIVSGLSLAAWYYGRRFKPLLIISLTAAMTAFWNPLYLWSDVGWYLSFLAFFGILVISPLVVRWIYGKRKNPSQLSLILIETTAAQLMTAPLILYIFSRASLIGLASNLIIGPLVPLAMVLTLVAGISGMVVPVLAGWLAWPARILLRYMLEVVAMFARVPHALVERSITIFYMVAMYLLIIIGTLLAWRSVRAKYGTITDKDTIV